MRDRSNNPDGADEIESISWDLPGRSCEESPESPASRYFTSQSSADLDLRTPTLPPPPPRETSSLPAPPLPPLPPMPSVPPVQSALPEPPAPEAAPIFAPPTTTWMDEAPSAEVRDFPESAQAATPYRPDRSEPGSIIDLSDHTDHPYDELYDLASEPAPAAPAEPSTRALPADLRDALLTATTAPAPDAPQPTDGEVTDLPVSSLSPLALSRPLPVVGADAYEPRSVAMISVDTLGNVPINISGLFTDVLTDNNFDPVEVNQTTTVLARGDALVTIDMLDEDHGCIVELESQEASPILRLMVAGFIEAGFTLRSCTDGAYVLGHDADCLVRLLPISVDS